MKEESQISLSHKMKLSSLCSNAIKRPLTHVPEDIMQSDLQHSFSFAFKSLGNQFSYTKKKQKNINIIYILERDERHHSYKIIRNRNNFSLIAKVPATHAESTPLKNNASVQQPASHQTLNKFLPKISCVIKCESVESKKDLHPVLLDQCSRVNIRIRNNKILPMSC